MLVKRATNDGGSLVKYLYILFIHSATVKPAVVSTLYESGPRSAP